MGRVPCLPSGSQLAYLRKEKMRPGGYTPARLHYDFPKVREQEVRPPLQSPAEERAGWSRPREGRRLKDHRDRAKTGRQGTPGSAGPLPRPERCEGVCPPAMASHPLTGGELVPGELGRRRLRRTSQLGQIRACASGKPTLCSHGFLFRVFSLSASQYTASLLSSPAV